jgi:hypothetical protein
MEAMISPTLICLRFFNNNNAKAQGSAMSHFIPKLVPPELILALKEHYCTIALGRSCIDGQRFI